MPSRCDEEDAAKRYLCPIRRPLSRMSTGRIISFILRYLSICDSMDSECVPFSADGYFCFSLTSPNRMRRNIADFNICSFPIVAFYLFASADYSA